MKVLVAFAVEEEVIDISLAGVSVVPVVTGIGKANAAFSLTRAILTENPDFVLNVGTSGTQKHTIGEIFVCNRFVDRDFARLKIPGIVTHLQTKTLLLPANGIVNTGDDFVTEGEILEGDVIDMEGFAEALVCHNLKIPFVAVKYITDIVGQNSVKCWVDKLADARRELQLFFANL